jgi:2'-hydroxyisoflavone reductase
MTTRREFIGLTTASMALMASGLKAEIVQSPRPLNILFLGGTGFLGPHQIEYALARGHNVTMFNRGRNAGMYGDRVEELVGNRDNTIDDGLSALQGDRRWDVVVDNSGYVPRHVRDSVELLKDRCDRYVYVSTVAVYDFDTGATEFPENAPLARLDDPTVEEVTGETYGPLKAACDLIVQEALGDRATIVRPTYVVGPGDHTDRFTYWAVRGQRGGDILAPNGPELVVQWVDARDLCPWIVTLAENGTPGIFNAAAHPYSRAGFLWALRAQSDQPAVFHWPTAEQLDEAGINMPMMRDSETPVLFVNSASVAAGLHYRSLADTARDTVAWWNAQDEERRANPRRWPGSEEEAALVAAIAAEAGG